jgi:hypothetical protein
MKLLNIFLILLISLLLLACSSNKEQLQVDTNLTAYSGDVVELHASGAKAYSWRQLSGTDVILVDAQSATPSFIAPSVKTQESLVFELEALMAKIVNDDIILKKQVSVSVLPKAVEIKKDTTNSNETNPSLRSIKLTLEKNSLNIETNTTLKVLATYSDNTIKDVTNKVEWVYEDKLALDIKNNILKTNNKDINLLLQAKYNNLSSNQVAIEIYKEINGHRLPPEPDSDINNATLLGVDTNNNDVRDDVERWIYEEYKEKHPIHMDIAMQAGKAYKQVLETPKRALEIMDYVEAPLYCELYYRSCTDNTYIGEIDRIDDRYFRHKIYFNTQERMDAYLQYDKLLSGGAYTLLRCSQRKQLCDFNTSKYEQ